MPSRSHRRSRAVPDPLTSRHGRWKVAKEAFNDNEEGSGLDVLCRSLGAPGGARERAAAGAGKAEMKAERGRSRRLRPSVAEGRDMLSQLQEGTFWRMGMNQATVLTTPSTSPSARHASPRGVQPLAEEDRRRVPDRLQLQTGQWGPSTTRRRSLHRRRDEGRAAEPRRDVHHRARARREGRHLRPELGATKLAAPFELTK